MSLQIFLHGKILGIEEFLRSARGDLAGRAQWTTLLSEVLPRALLAELRLSNVLLGSSGGGQFILVLPDTVRTEAEEFCKTAATAVRERSGGVMSMVWAITENLGSWTDVRKRLLTDLYARANAPGWNAATIGEEPANFTAELREGGEIGWSPERPASFDGTTHRWTLGRDIPFASHFAIDDEGTGVASLDALASRAGGRWLPAVLRGDVDDFGGRLRRAETVEDHLQISLMFKQFFAGELQMRCSLPEYWRKVSLLYAGGQDFAIVGAWDAVIGLAREIQRLFALFVETNLRDFPGAEGRTISMAIAVAGDADATPEGLFAEAGDKLSVAKSSGRDAVWVLGRTLDWKQLSDAAESRAIMTRLIREFGVPRQLLGELAVFYNDAPEGAMMPGTRRVNVRIDKPWRFYRRLNAMLGTQTRGKDFQRLRTDLIGEFTGRRASNVRLRPQGRVALEWASLETEAV